VRPRARAHVQPPARTYTLDVVTSEEVAQLLQDRFRSPAYKPPRLPAVALKMMELSRQPDVTAEELQTVLEQDGVLAGKVLERTKSTAYAGRVAPATLRDALVRLGLKTLGDIVLEEAMTARVFRTSHYSEVMEDLRRHSIATAYAARAVARFAKLGAAAEESAFLSGLLHDVGAAAALLILGDVPRGKTPPTLEYAWPAIEAVHQKASGWLAKLWGMPEPIQAALTAHHLCTDDAGPLGWTVALAEALVSERGYGVRDEVASNQKARALDRLVLSESALAELETYIDSACERIA
jgi:HD-like signal output (HDOD) protein